MLALLLAVASLVAASGLEAEEAGSGQVALDAGLVERMISASQAVFEIREQAASANAGEEGDDGAAEDLTPAENAELEAIVQQHGFKTLDEFDTVSASVMTALMRIELDDPQLATEIKEEMARVEADPELTPEVKEDMLAALRMQLEPPAVAFPANIAVVRPFKDELRALFEGGLPEEEIEE